MTLEHERVVVAGGTRSTLPIIVAVHSTVLGPALGGCRVWTYPSWRDGLDDALRLSAAMTVKCAAAGLEQGGGKTVVAVPAGVRLDAAARRDLLLDIGDLVDSFGGGYATGPDVGSTPADMITVAERTRHVHCLPESAGGSGDSAPPTAAGVLAAIRATCRYRYGSGDLGGRTIAILGLGRVGGALARALGAEGAELTVADVDPGRRAEAAALGAAWVSPEDALTAPVDVLVPAALGGVLTAEVVPRLRCAVIAGPANNQLAEDGVADALHRRGIIWAPDCVVSAGGVIYATHTELRGAGPDQALEAVRGIGELLTAVLSTAERRSISPHRAVRELVAQRLRRPDPSTVD